MAYLHHYYEPDSKNEQTRMQQQAKDYQIVGNELYKTFVLGPLLRCISKTKGQEILQDVHARIWRAAKVLPQGFYWLAMIDDAAKLVATSKACQKFSHHYRAPAQLSSFDDC
jgi:hypothetical protein